MHFQCTSGGLRNRKSKQVQHPGAIQSATDITDLMIRLLHYLDCRNITAHGAVNLPCIRGLIKMQPSYHINIVLKELHSHTNIN